MGQGLGSIPLGLQRLVFCRTGGAVAEGVQMNQQFDHAANDSPRSGSSKRVTPVVWAVIIVALIVVAILFAMKL